MVLNFSCKGKTKIFYLFQKGRLVYKGRSLFVVVFIIVFVISIASHQRPQNVVFSKYTRGLVENVAWGPGEIIAVSTTAGKVFVFDGNTGDILWEKYVGLVQELAWSPSGRLAVATRREVVIFDKDGAHNWSLKWPKPPGAGWEISEGEVSGIDWIDGDTLAVLVSRTIHVEVNRSEDGSVTYTLYHNYTLYAYREGEALWSVDVGGTERLAEPEDDFVQAGDGYLLVKIPDKVSLFNDVGESLWSKTVNTTIDFHAALGPGGHVAVSYWCGEEVLVKVYDPEGVENYSFKKCFVVERLAFTADGGLVTLCDDSLLFYGQDGGLEWSVRAGLYEIFEDASVSPGGKVAVSWYSNADFDVYHAGSKNYFTFKGSGVRVYSGGSVTQGLPGCRSAWSEENKLAVWCSGILWVYDDGRELWHRKFLGSVERVSFNYRGEMAVVVNPLSKPVFLDVDGRHVWNFSGDIDVYDAFYENNYLVLLGHDNENSYIMIYDADYDKVFEKRFGKQYLDEDYYELVVPAASVNGRGELALLTGGENLQSRLEIYNLTSGELMVEVEIGVGLKPLRVYWVGDDRIVFLTSGLAGVVSRNGTIIFKKEVVPPDIQFPDICMPDDDHVAILSDGTLSLYTIDSEKLWDYTYHIDRMTCGEGVIAAASYYVLYVLNIDGGELWRNPSFLQEEDAISMVKWHGDKLFVGTEKGKLLAYDVKGRNIFEKKLAPGISTVGWGPNDLLAVGTRGGLFVLDLKMLHKVTLEVRLPSDKFILEVDGQRFDGPNVRLELVKGLHKLRVEEKIVYEGCEYVFQGWSDGVRQNPRTINLNESLVLEARYSPKRCLVQARTSFSKIIGAGWYEYGSTAILKISETVVDFGNGTRAIFIGWNTGEKSPKISINVQGPVEIVAMWKKQYLVSVSSEHGNVVGGGWFDEGSTIRVGVKDTEVIEGDKRYVFAGWVVNGKEAGSERYIILKVTEPIIVEALWEEAGAAVRREGLSYMILLIGAVFVVGVLLVLGRKFMRKKK